MPPTPPAPVVLDDFEDLTPWKADASTDVSSAISAVAGPDGGKAMRLDYDFNGKSGYAFAARALSFTAPANYEIRFRVRGAGPSNTFEVKFTDASAENVHWRQTTRYTFPDGWTEFVIKKRQVSWAWGPNPDHAFRGAERIEFVVTAGEGGKGFIEVDDLTLRELPPEPAVPPRPLATATSEDGTSVAASAVDGDPATVWRSTSVGEQSLTLDLGYEREFGGLTLKWAERSSAAKYRVMASPDGDVWTGLAEVDQGDGGTDWLRTPEASARFLRFDLLAPPAVQARTGAQMGAGQGREAAQTSYALSEVAVEPLAFGKDETAFLSAVARQSRRGLYPRGFVGEQPYWTLVGVDGGGESALISEDGAIELRRGGPSVEPFVLDNGRLVTWADVRIEQGLVDGYLPIPTVTWTHEGWTLKVTALAEGDVSPNLYGRYDLTNTSSRPLTLTLALAARPVQVNGPSQFLTTPGGASPMPRIEWRSEALNLGRQQWVQPMALPTRVVGGSFEAGADPQSLIGQSRAALPDGAVVNDPAGLASMSLLYDVTLAPGETRTFGWVGQRWEDIPMQHMPGDAAAALTTVQTRVATVWREKLDRFDLITPPEGQRIADTMKTSLAHMLMSRQGPRLQPGTRSYNRSWIRDGAMMAEGLDRLGHADLSADYLRFYAPFVFSDGKVPCCVDQRGADPVPENDSHGEFIFLAAETYRYTHDEALLRSVWPQVQAAVAYMDTLRASTRVPANRTRETRHLYGLLPPTISHEGYSDKAAYSFWDDFWGLLGYKDAVFIAETLGDTAAAQRFSAARDEFQTDIRNAITGTAIRHHIDFIAGAADRGDFDATSTSIALSPAGAQADLPQGLMKRTFEKYWENFTARQENRNAWKDYTPYELRNVGVFVRLGQRDRAMRALDFFFADRRPQAWNGWAEVVGRDLREPRFIGDMPHAWISSDYIRSALDLFVYERDSDHALVLAAGLPLDWVDSPTGVGVREVRTAYGALSYSFRKDGAVRVLTIEPGVTPPGGFVVQWPDGVDLPPRPRIDGRRGEWKGREVVIPAGARRVEFR
ncbi:MAG: carbohydrate-binding protein, partial [Caulobacteraceae bacterium]|nr:carbohydrate-binding protein [Caulobacteraceae bacterium]